MTPDGAPDSAQDASFSFDSEPSAYALGLIAARVAKAETWLYFSGARGARWASRVARYLPQATLRGHTAGAACLGPVALVEAVRGALQGSQRADFVSPDLAPGLRLAFIRGLFDARGEVLLGRGTSPLQARLKLGSKQLARSVSEALGGQRHGREVRWTGVNALDALGQLYDAAGSHAPKQRRLYLAAATSVPGALAGACLDVCRLKQDAILPAKERVSDSGYDLTLIELKQRFGAITLYGTGLSVRPPPGYYFDVVPRSSIIKRGYLMANSVGVIDRAYRGELMVPLVKVDQNAPELELPARVAQLIPRPILHFPVRERPNLDDTSRGAGGFGSTG